VAHAAEYDAVVVGAGPNGLAAAITLAHERLSVLLVEGSDTVGGGARSAELTLPGFKHDVCSSIYPLAVASAFLSTIPLGHYGVEWVHPEAPLAHPLDEGTAVVLTRSVAATSQGLGVDGPAYSRLMTPLARHWVQLSDDLLRPLHWPAHPLILARFAMLGMRSARGLAEGLFQQHRAQSLFAGLASHSIMPLESRLTAAFGLVLGAAGHAVGWPLVVGGSQSLSNALASYFKSLGGEIVTGFPVASLAELPPARVILLDLTPRQLVRVAGRRLPDAYRRRLERYRYGPGIFKVDWALDRPIPWQAPECIKAATIHLGGTLPEIAEAEYAPWHGRHAVRPFVILTQPSLFDRSRAPGSMHTAWAYCHVPNASDVDMSYAIEQQVERFAPGFRERISARHTMTAKQLETYNPNYIGGDIGGGIQDLHQLFTRPASAFVPYATPVEGLYICSSSTPPGGGVHGMCGYYAARAALGHLRRRAKERSPSLIT